MAQLAGIVLGAGASSRFGAQNKLLARFRDRPGLTWRRSQPSLEDVFIDLMGKAKDNFQ